MKKLFTTLLIIICFAGLFVPQSVVAASPQKMSYQAIVRNAKGELVTNQKIGMKISIYYYYKLMPLTVYSETQTPTTNENGLLTIVIGTGTIVSGVFAEIEWSSHLFYMKTEIDPGGKTSYTITSDTQFLSTPYAFHANTANKLTGLNTLSIPAFALTFSPSSTTISHDYEGLRWKQSYANGAHFDIKKPSNYIDGDVELTIYFKTTTSIAGVVDFFIRPNSLNQGDGIIDPGSINSTSGVNVSGKIGFGTVYEQKFTIPADRLEKNWWQIIIQNKGKASTYTGVVILKCVSLTY